MHERLVYFATGLPWETRKCMGREQCKVSGHVIQLIKEDGSPQDNVTPEVVSASASKINDNIYLKTKQVN